MARFFGHPRPEAFAASIPTPVVPAELQRLLIAEIEAT